MEDKNINSLVPKIRFKGFTSAWEQQRLGDVASCDISNNTFSRQDLEEIKGEIQDVHYGDVLIKFNDILDLTKDILPSIISEKLGKYHPDFLKNGDIVMADTAEDATVGKVVEINNISNQKVVAGLHTIVFRPKICFGKYFLGFFLNSNQYHNQLTPLMQGIKVYSLTRKALVTTIISYPKDVEEQKKVGLLFEKLSTLLTLRQCEPFFHHFIPP